MTKENDLDALLHVHLAARCPLLFLLSWEEERVIRHLTALAAPLFDAIWLWSITDGMRKLGEASLDEKYQGPYAALEYIGSTSQKALFILLDFHPYIAEAKITRKIRDLVHNLQSTSSSIIFLAPKLNLPAELEKDMAVIDYPLPSIDDLQYLFETIKEGVKENPSLEIQLNEEEKDRLLQAAVGLTENEAKNVFAKAFASNKRLSIADIDLILSEKEQIVRKSGILEYFSTPETFASLGGMDVLKSWLRLRAGVLTKRARDFHLPPPKGLLLIGVPGCGKSLAAKVVASEWNQPLLKLDVGRLFAGIVGSSEENIRRTIHFAEAVSPCVLWIDEIEKGFAGFRGAGDSGTASRVFSTFLTWMQEKSSPVFVIATANDIRALPPELLRKGRFDDLFFVDLPFTAEREAIFNIHLLKRQRDPETLRIDVSSLAQETEGFSGTELEQAIIDALYGAFAGGTDLDTELLRTAIKETIPLSETMKEPIHAMREWARSRARYASSMWRDSTGQAQPVGRWRSIGTLA